MINFSLLLLWGSSGHTYRISCSTASAHRCIIYLPELMNRSKKKRFAFMKKEEDENKLLRKCNNEIL